MNIMFLLIPALLLAMEVASMAAIQVSPPKFSSAPSEKKEEEKKDKEPLNLKVFVMEDGFRVSASGQQEGADAGQSADSNRPTIPLAKPSAPMTDFERYDYPALEAVAKKYKTAFPHENVVKFSAESSIPMQVLVTAMDAVRGFDCKLMSGDGETLPPECLFFLPIVEAGAG
jgi:hypothetical protein